MSAQYPKGFEGERYLEGKLHQIFDTDYYGVCIVNELHARKNGKRFAGKPGRSTGMKSKPGKKKDSIDLSTLSILSFRQSMHFEAFEQAAYSPLFHFPKAYNGGQPKLSAYT